MWCRSSVYAQTTEFRKRAMLQSQEKELGPPDLVCLSYTHDRDFGVFKAYPQGKEKFAETAWCPPAHAAYDGWQDATVKDNVAEADGAQ